MHEIKKKYLKYLFFIKLKYWFIKKLKLKADL